MPSRRLERDNINEGDRFRIKSSSAVTPRVVGSVFVVRQDPVTTRLVEPRYDGKLTVWGVVEGDGPWRMLLEDLEPLEETPPKPLLAAAKAERPSAPSTGTIGGAWHGSPMRPEHVEYERPMERAFIRDTIVRRLFETDPRIIALIERVAEVEPSIPTEEGLARRSAAMKRAWERARAPTKRCVEIDVFEECQNRVAAMFPPDSP